MPRTGECGCWQPVLSLESCLGDVDGSPTMTPLPPTSKISLPTTRLFSHLLCRLIAVPPTWETRQSSTRQPEGCFENHRGRHPTPPVYRAFSRPRFVKAGLDIRHIRRETEARRNGKRSSRRIERFELAVHSQDHLGRSRVVPAREPRPQLD